MTSLDFENIAVQSSTTVVYKATSHNLSSSSSRDLPSVESSIKFEPGDSPKMKLYKKGLYSPGSGEICAKYIPLSDSEMLINQYYMYPSVEDPGIMKALLFPEEEGVYNEDGQDLYLDLCRDMNVIPIRSFHRSLKEKAINLRYYGVNPVGVRAMCLALAYNKTVKSLDLTSNFLEHDDACYHLGQLLGDRNCLQELILAGCRIGHKGMRRLVVCLSTRSITLLDLSGNNIRNLGFSYLAKEIERGAVIKKLNVSRNDLTSESLLLMAQATKLNDTMNYLDLSWNIFFEVRGPTTLFQQLRHSHALVQLNLSWTSLCITVGLRDLLEISTLQELNLSNNRLPSLAARNIGRGLHLAKTLKILDLSSNPFSPEDALFLLRKMKRKIIKLRELRMDHIVVNKEFAEELKEILALEFRKNTNITHGYVLHNYMLPLVDIKIITLRRLVQTMNNKRRKKLDILTHLLELNKTQDNVDSSDLIHTLKLYDMPVDEDLIDSIVTVFPGPKDKSERTINLIDVADYIHRLWPEKKAPPTPPPPTPSAETFPVKSIKKKGQVKKNRN